jgi:uncharacterized membrane protein YeaQ/YmgE (transglycosylase-associated protein family)
MNVLEFIILLVMAGVLGVVAQKILGARYGMVVSVILGLVGAIVGSQLADWFHFPARYAIRIGPSEVQVVWALVGALIVTFGAGIIAKSNRKAQQKK